MIFRFFTSFMSCFRAVTRRSRFSLARRLRTLCRRSDNLQLPVRWQTQDLIDSGWVTLEDLKDIDRQTYINNHTLLCGRIQDHVGIDGLKAFDNWLHAQGLPRATPYTRSYRGGSPDPRDPHAPRRSAPQDPSPREHPQHSPRRRASRKHRAPPRDS